jgi:AI-2 transport protein TqsA
MKEQKIIIALLGILAVIASGIVLSAMQSVLLPFVLAFFLTYVFKPVVIALRKRKVPMAVAVLAVLLLVFAVITGIAVVIGASAKSFIVELPKYQGKLEQLLTGAVASIEQTGRNLGLIKQEFRVEDVVQLSAITSLVTSSVGSFISFLSNAFLVLLFMIFMLAGTGQLIRKLDFISGDLNFARISNVLASIDRQVRQYMLTKTLISLANGLLATIALSILGVDFALLWGFLVFLLNYIPNIGSLIATAFPVLISLLQFDSITVPVIALVLLVVIQNVMGNVIEPKLMAFSLDLSPLLILASLLFWGWIWGVWGMILSVPIMAILKIVFENISMLKPVSVLMSGGPPRASS